MAPARLANGDAPRPAVERHSPAPRGQLVVYMACDRYALQARRRLKRHR